MSNVESTIFPVSGTGLQITPSLLTWQEIVTYYGFAFTEDDALTDAFMLMEAYLTAQDPDGGAPMVKPGDPHPFYANTFATVCMVNPTTQDSTVHVTQTVTYMQPGPQCMMQFDSYQQTEGRNFAEDLDVDGHTLTTVKYVPQIPGSPTLNLRVPFVATVQTPAIVRAVRVIQYEILTGDTAIPGAVSGPSRPVWNIDDFCGYAAGTLLFIGVESQNDGTPIFKRTYTFLINIYGWHHFYGLWVDARGLKPQDVVPIDPLSVTPDTGTVQSTTPPYGAAGWRMLPNKKFATFFAQLKPPFNVGNVSVPTETDTGRTGPLGDFPQMPVSTLA